MICSHYTSQEGLLGIIDSGCLWATNILYLNDENEYLDAIQHLRNLIPKTKSLKDEFYQMIVGDYKRSLFESLDSLEKSWRKRNYLVSFSKESDLLSQWRGYCPENNGYGIVFDTEEIRKRAEKRFSFVYYGNCIYSSQAKLENLKQKLNQTYIKFRDVIGDQESITDCMETLEQELDELACLFKDESFSEEKEVRLVVILDGFEGSKACKFRTGKTSIIPYIEVEFPPESIKQIIIGPTLDQVRAKYSLEQLLFRKFGLEMPEIILSKVPYRFW